MRVNALYTDLRGHSRMVPLRDLSQLEGYSLAGVEQFHEKPKATLLVFADHRGKYTIGYTIFRDLVGTSSIESRERLHTLVERVEALELSESQV